MALMEANLGNGWFEIPTPKPEGYFPSYTHLEDSYNDSKGNLHRDFIWKNRAKLECSWNSLSGDKYSTLQDLYDAKEFPMRFTDNKGRRVEKIMYGGTLKGNVYKKDKITYKPILWTNITMNFIEKRR